MTRPKPEEGQPEAPAKVRAGHVQEDELTTVAGGAKAWRNQDEHVIEAAMRRGKISMDEAAAADVYRAFWELRGRTGETKFELVGSNPGPSTPWAQRQANAVRALEAVEAELKKFEEGARWVIVCRRFCGDGYEAAEALRAAGFTNANKTWERMRLALSKLSTAISRSRIDLSPVRTALE